MPVRKNYLTRRLGFSHQVTRTTYPPIVIPTGARSAEWRDLVMASLTPEAAQAVVVVSNSGPSYR
jgi:hypothetical protein